MSNTPRTDALIHAPNGNYFSASATDFRNLCLELEQELGLIRQKHEDCLTSNKVLFDHNLKLQEVAMAAKEVHDFEKEIVHSNPCKLCDALGKL